jgi:hypothetical protein
VIIRFSSGRAFSNSLIIRISPSPSPSFPVT